MRAIWGAPALVWVGGQGAALTPCGRWGQMWYTPVDRASQDSFRKCPAGCAVRSHQHAGLLQRSPDKHRLQSPSRQQWCIVAAMAQPETWTCLDKHQAACSISSGVQRLSRAPGDPARAATVPGAGSGSCPYTLSPRWRGSPQAPPLANRRAAPSPTSGTNTPTPGGSSLCWAPSWRWVK